MQNRATTTKLAKAIVTLGFFLMILLIAAYVTAPRSSAVNGFDTSPVKYSEFPHDKHKFDCDSCHKFPSSNWKSVRSDPFPDISDYPRHDSCLKCHRQQFFGSGAKPVICSICHINPSPRDSSRWPFPNPRENFDKTTKGKTATSDFGVTFPHLIHVEIVSSHRTSKPSLINASFIAGAEDSCKVCHQTYKPQGDSDDEYFTKPPADLGDRFWLKKGTFKTTPLGHTVCFTCHSEDSGIQPAPSSCGTCHSLKIPLKSSDFDPEIASAMKIEDKVMLDAWRRRDSSATFRHEWATHADLECANCHKVAQINTLDPATRRIDINSCAVCHITATVDDGGILNYEVAERSKSPKFRCVKCHLAYGSSSIPETHTKAIAAQGGE